MDEIKCGVINLAVLASEGELRQEPCPLSERREECASRHVVVSEDWGSKREGGEDDAPSLVAKARGDGASFRAFPGGWGEMSMGGGE